jgi:type I restriction enzyme, S subunit
MPNSWKLLTLGDVANWTSGGTPSSKNSDYYDGDIPWVCIGDLNEGSVLETAKKITKAGLDSSSAKIMPKGTIMLAMYATSIGDTGMMETNMATNQAIACGVPNPEMIVGKYLLYYLQSQKHEFFAAGRGGAQPNINQGIVKSWPIPIPSIDEQHQILELLEDHLSRLEAALADVKQARIKAAQFRRSLLQSAFTGNLTGDGTRLMTSYPSTWKIESLDSLINRGIIKLNRGDIISKRDIAAHPGEYPIYSSAKENNGVFGRYGKYMFDEEVITWSIDGGGRLFYREKQKFSVTNVGGILRIIDKSVFDYKFLFYALTNLHSQVVFDWSRKAHPSVIRMVYDKVPIPPLAEQHKIVELLEDHLSRLDALVAIADAMEKQSSSLRRSLLQAAFTGQLIKEVASV